MMGGWKTWTAAVAMVLWGGIGLVTGIHSYDVAIGFVTGGLALVGIGHKIEKLGGPPA